MSTQKIAYITTCKGRLEHLSKTLPIVAAQASANVEVIVVDYGCPEGAGDWVEKHYPNVKVIRITDDPEFNLSRARNVGAANTQAEWLGFFDADIILKKNFFVTVRPTLKSGNYYLARRNDPNTWGSCIVERNAFHKVGGYDEVIKGYGGEDNDLYEMLATLGVIRNWYSGDAITPINHTDENRTQFYNNKNIDLSVRINHCYRVIKSDITRLNQRLLTLLERQQLRKQIEDKLVACAEMHDQETLTTPILRIAIPERELKTRPTLAAALRPKIKTYLSYELTQYSQESSIHNHTDETASAFSNDNRDVAD